VARWDFRCFCACVYVGFGVSGDRQSVLVRMVWFWVRFFEAGGGSVFLLLGRRGEGLSCVFLLLGF